jgi:hypothetical protein
MAPQSCAAAGAVAKITMETVARTNVRMPPLAFSFFSLVLQLLMVLFVPSGRARKLDGAAASLFLQ